MEHVVWKPFYDYEKEEKYLNEMSQQGLALKKYTWCRYVFEDAPQGEYIYRIELLEHSISHPESQKYINFMEETGAEFVTSYFQWVYFRRRVADGEFNIYSDIASKTKHYKRIRALFVVVMVINFVAGLGNLLAGNAAIVKFSFYITLLSFLIAALFLLFLVVPLSKKINALEKEKKISE